jgi:hypothetical protein
MYGWRKHKMQQIKKIKQALEVVGGLSAPSKMPCSSYSISAKRCNTGSKLAKIEGTVCHNCYALKGNYVRYAKTIDTAHERRYQALSNPQWVEAMSFIINKQAMQYFRWHDSGDIQSFQHLLNIVSVADNCPNTQFWIPTKEFNLVKQYLDTFGSFPNNLIVRVSATKRDSNPPKFQFTSTVHLANSAMGTECPSYKQGGKCLDCRNCWDKSIPNVSYKYH